MRKSKILGSGIFVPKRTISNQYFDEALGENVSDWLENNAQIYQRHWCEEDESVLDLCLQASKTALENAAISVEEIDLIIVATDTPEYISPSTSTKLQDLLQAKNAAAFDVNSACAGFITALDIANKYIASDKKYNKVLVLGAYAMSKYLNKTDKKTVTLFADGAGAFVMGHTIDENEGYLSSNLISQGQYADWMGIYAGASHQPTTPEVIENGDHQLKFIKRFPGDLNHTMWAKMARDLCEEINISPSDVDHYFFTQLNINSIIETMKLLDQPMEKTTTVMHQNGYTGSACIPMAFDEAIQKKKVKKGDLVFLIGSGGGLTFGSIAYQL
ncbi:ketoacyl-ACP synthase III [Flammeovirga sp. MY04]|uniref:3-oxoacyl-ACP synthase III family protein n=1 Tax=Flammeovirga sp. MY04 TaxID=1191459 RepID=UPI000A0057E6|nr:ketoacyl-ACP synthase III [Flammeovirga sp. MY04]ANQ52635.2 ketoacyl-ACP synthase III [Flammeovirga sp. MY04]